MVDFSTSLLILRYMWNIRYVLFMGNIINSSLNDFKVSIIKELIPKCRIVIFTLDRCSSDKQHFKLGSPKFILFNLCVRKEFTSSINVVYTAKKWSKLSTKFSGQITNLYFVSINMQNHHTYKKPVLLRVTEIT